MMKFQKIMLFIFSIASFHSYSEIDIDKLPQDKNKDLIIQNCLSCHSLQLVVQNKKDRKGWLYTIQWMQKEHNLRKFTPKEENQILDYLEKYFSPKQNDKAHMIIERPVNPLP